MTYLGTLREIIFTSPMIYTILTKKGCSIPIIDPYKCRKPLTPKAYNENSKTITQTAMFKGY